MSEIPDSPADFASHYPGLHQQIRPVPGESTTERDALPPAAPFVALGRLPLPARARLPPITRPGFPNKSLDRRAFPTNINGDDWFTFIYIEMRFYPVNEDSWRRNLVQPTFLRPTITVRLSIILYPKPWFRGIFTGRLISGRRSCRWPFSLRGILYIAIPHLIRNRERGYTTTGFKR